MDAQVDLTGLNLVERELLRLGVMQSGGSKDEVARLLEFDDRSALRADVDRLAGLVASGGPMSRRDCRRVLLATELAFASETLGCSRDWSADTGFADRDTIAVLRTIQEKIAGIVHGSDDRATDVAPQLQPAWSPISMDADDEYWTPFHRRFDFRPGMHSGRPAIAEPVPSVTVDLGPIFAARSHPEFAAGARAVNSLTLLALVRMFEPDTSLVVLDWQHQTHRFWPDRLACQPDPQWQTEVFPNGDYYIFLTEDMSTGTFGHPWEQTLCVFGEPLVSALVPLLTSWLPIKRTNR
ncbi:DUF2716 domain-containing protein [Catellatospora sichuanensis]|uniref:DUF2716 domain-containing protein n=1 Tax=Catellatospora sichuanensis TaxID=1969805 RepID=UPI001C9258BF|nr:DUF2716 domain-containing protein [Catellatospora sichuanensis]